MSRTDFLKPPASPEEMIAFTHQQIRQEMAVDRLRRSNTLVFDVMMVINNALPADDPRRLPSTRTFVPGQ